MATTQPKTTINATYRPFTLCQAPECGTAMHDLPENRQFHTDERHGGADPGYLLATREAHEKAGWGVEDYPASITL